MLPGMGIGTGRAADLPPVELEVCSWVNHAAMNAATPTTTAVIVVLSIGLLLIASMISPANPGTAAQRAMTKAMAPAMLMFCPAMVISDHRERVEFGGKGDRHVVLIGDLVAQSFEVGHIGTVAEPDVRCPGAEEDAAIGTLIDEHERIS